MLELPKESCLLLEASKRRVHNDKKCKKIYGLEQWFLSDMDMCRIVRLSGEDWKSLLDKYVG